MIAIVVGCLKIDFAHAQKISFSVMMHNKNMTCVVYKQDQNDQ